MVYRGHKAHRQVVFTLLTTAIAMTTALIITLIYFHPRPFMIHLGHTWIYRASETSFPSGHATFFFSIALGLFISGNKIWGFVVFIMSLLVGWARVFLGVHFPFDIIGAFFVVCFSIIIALSIWNKIGVRLTKACEGISKRLFYGYPQD